MTLLHIYLCTNISYIPIYAKAREYSLNIYMLFFCFVFGMKLFLCVPKWWFMHVILQKEWLLLNFVLLFYFVLYINFLGKLVLCVCFVCNKILCKQKNESFVVIYLKVKISFSEKFYCKHGHGRRIKFKMMQNVYTV